MGGGGEKTQRVRKEEQEGADIKHRVNVGVKQSFVFIPHPAELISILPFLLRVSTRQPLKQARSGLKLQKSSRWAAPTPSCGPPPPTPTRFIFSPGSPDTATSQAFREEKLKV